MASGEMRCTTYPDGKHRLHPHIRQCACGFVEIEPAAVPESAIEPEPPQVSALCRMGIHGSCSDCGCSCHAEDENCILPVAHEGPCVVPAASSAIEVAPQRKTGIAVSCTVCGHRKKPRGRSAPVGLHMCESECPGYDQKPLVGDLWPGETEEDFGYPCSDNGTNASVAPGEAQRVLADELHEKAEKYREIERVARNEGNNSIMDSAAGKAGAFYVAARMAAVPSEAQPLADICPSCGSTDKNERAVCANQWHAVPSEIAPSREQKLEDALRECRKIFERQGRAICGNDKLSGCEEFYRGYNAVVQQENAAGWKGMRIIDDALETK